MSEKQNYVYVVYQNASSEFLSLISEKRRNWTNYKIALKYRCEKKLFLCNLKKKYWRLATGALGILSFNSKHKKMHVGNELFY